MPLALLAAACTQQKTDVETVVFEKSDTISPFSDAIKKIELVPLETADAFLLGGELELTPVESGYVVTDVPSSQILFFAPDGSFRNRIGMSGNGDGTGLEPQSREGNGNLWDDENGER